VKTAHKIIATLIAALLLLALGAGASFWAFNQMEKASDARRHIYAVIIRANNLLASLTNAELGQRGYLLTGDERFLEPYLDARDSVLGQLLELRKLTSATAASQHLDTVSLLIDVKLEYLSLNIKLRRNQEIATALANLRGSQGKPLMDTIRGEMHSFIQTEEGELANREAAYHSNVRYLFAFMVVASLLVLLLALAFTFMIYRETRRKIKYQQAQYARALIEASPDPLVTISPQGKITDVNEASVQATGVPREQLIGTDFCDYFTEPEQARAVYRKVFSDGIVRNYPLALRHTSGRLMDVLYNAALYRDEHGKVHGVFAAARDDTERKRLDIALQANYAELKRAKSVADKANLAKSEFLSCMSRELRSPLNAILGFAQLMESDTPPPTPAQKENLEQILLSGWHLLKLMNETIDLAKLESGQAPMLREAVSLDKVLLECKDLIEPLAQQRDIRIFYPQHDIPSLVQADPSLVKQVLLNLLSNAVKYNREHGTVEVNFTASRWGRIRVSIADTGPGLSLEQLAQLFQPFNRLGQQAGGEEGTGIGLVVSKRLLELMDGTIGVESTVGVGSVFWFELNPAEVAPPAIEESATATQPHAPRADKPYTLLYVEDNPANLKLVERIIARQPNMRLLTATNGHSGIDIAHDQQPDLILMDINMPGISGFEAMRILRSDPATKHIPIVAVSANAKPLDIERGREAGFFRYLTKPIKVDEFMDVLNVALKFAETGTDVKS